MELDFDLVYAGSRRNSPPVSPRSDTSNASNVPVDENGYTKNLRDLIDFLQTTSGVAMFKAAYRSNMLHKSSRYSDLLKKANEGVRQQKDVIDIKVPALKRAANVDAGDKSDNWNIFEWQPV